jgi:hypothetical protein
LRLRQLIPPAVALVLSLLSTEARADGGTIVRVRSSSGPLDERLSAELATLGFEVKEIVSNDPEADLAQIAHANGASAAVRVNNDDTVELWASSRQGTEPPIHEVIHIDPRNGWNLAAVSALESLRAHLLRVRDERTPPPPQGRREEEPPRARAMPTSTPPRLWVHAAGGAEASPGGLGPAAEILGELRFEPRSWLSVSALGVIGPVSSQVEGPEGVASVRHSMAGAAMDVQARTGVMTISGGLGAALAIFSFSGQARSPGYGGRDDSIVTLGPILRSCVSADVMRTLRLRTQLLVGITFPHAVIHFAEREVADWGWPFGLATLGLEWGAPY